MRRSTLLFACLCLLASLSALAQDFSSLEERMTYSEFRAAGLEKLSPEELAALNAWLREKLPQQANVAPLPQVQEDRRGLPHRAADEGPAGDIVSRIPGVFTGWQHKQTITLENGQVWQVNDSTAMLAGIRVENVEVRISCGLMGGWYMRIAGYNSTAKVKRLK